MENNENVSKDEQVGFHKGALKTLAAERQELSKIVGIVEQLMNMHLEQLKELGVDLVAQAQNTQNTSQSPAQNTNTSSEPIENILNK
ncbi:hypothetical protein GOV05_04195 [Candidatus Woesearchaeota archaeon]|nr:hypothetical protein [Candidatus Woesearchaeota archaeon]